jgi:hypothetical protein
VNTKKITGWLLIAGPIIFLGFGILNPAASADWKSNMDIISELASNPTMAAISGIFNTIGAIIVLGGISGLKETISNSSNYKFASLSVIFIAVGVVLNAVSQALMLSTADAASKGEIPVASTMLAGYLGVAQMSAIILFIGVTIMGISLYLEKSLNSLVLVLLIIIGIIGIAIPFWDSIIIYSFYRTWDFINNNRQINN